MEDHDKKPKAEQRALEPNAEGNVRVEVLTGPYRGQHLTMTAADGQSAINDHWARNPSEALYEHEPLSDEDRTHAFEASQAWAKAQWDASQGITPPDPPPPEGGEGGITRDMQGDEPGRYTTRSTKPRRTE